MVTYNTSSEMRDSSGKWRDSVLSMDASTRNHLCYFAKLTGMERASLSLEVKKFKRRLTQSHWNSMQKYQKLRDVMDMQTLQDVRGGGEGDAATTGFAALVTAVKGANGEYYGGAAANSSTMAPQTHTEDLQRQPFVAQPLRDAQGSWEPWLLGMKLTLRRQLTSELSDAERIDLSAAVARFKGKLRTQRSRERKANLLAAVE